MKHFGSLLFLVLLTSCSLGPQIAQSPQLHREIQSFTLSNQLEAVVISTPDANTSGVALNIGVGGMDDPTRFPGMAHYLEHMLFLGNQDYPKPNEFKHFIEQHGGTLEAFTYLTHTEYAFEIANDAFPAALSRFAAQFRAPLFNPEYMEKEKSAVQAEWSANRALDYRIKDRLHTSLLGTHPANRFFVGNLQALADKPDISLHQALTRFYNEQYSAHKMKLVVIGNAPIEELSAQVKREFSGIQRHETPASSLPEFTPNGASKLTYKTHNGDHRLGLSFVIKNNVSQFKSKPNKYLVYLLGANKPGSLNHLLLNQGLISAFDIHISSDEFGNYGKLEIDYQLTPKGRDNKARITGLTLKYLELIQQKGINADYAAELKSILTNRFRFEWNHTSSAAEALNLASNMRDYPLEHIFDAAYLYESFDPQAIQSLMAQLVPDNLTLWIGEPAPETNQQLSYFDGNYKLEPLTQRELEDFYQQAEQTALSLPGKNPYIAESFTIFAPPEQPQKEIQYPDGFEVYLYHHNYYASRASGIIKLHLNLAPVASPLERQLAISLWSRILGKRLTTIQFDAGRADMSLALDHVNYQGLMLQLSGFTDKQFALLEDALTEVLKPISNTEFEQEKQILLAEMARKDSNYPFGEIKWQLERLSYGQPQDMPTLIAELKGLTLEQMHGYSRRALSENNLRALMFGNYAQKDADKLGQIVSRHFPSRQPIAFADNNNYAATAGTVIHKKLDISAADSAVADVYLFPNSDIPAKGNAMLLAQLLQSAFYHQLRTEQQLAYALDLVNIELTGQHGIALVLQSPVANTAKIMQAYQDFLHRAQGVIKNLNEQDFAQAKEALQQRLYSQHLDFNSEQLGGLAEDWLTNKPNVDSLYELNLYIDALTREQLAESFQQLLTRETSHRIILALTGENHKG